MWPISASSVRREELGVDLVLGQGRQAERGDELARPPRSGSAARRRPPCAAAASAPAPCRPRCRRRRSGEPASRSRLDAPARRGPRFRPSRGDSTNPLSCVLSLFQLNLGRRRRMAGIEDCAAAGARRRAALALAACDNGPSAVAQKQAAGTQMAANAAAPDVAPTAAPVRRRAAASTTASDPVKLVRRQADVVGQPQVLRRGERPARLRPQRRGVRRRATSTTSCRRPTPSSSHPPKGTLTLTRRQRRHPVLRPQGQCLRRGQQGRRAAHHVQAGRGHGLLGGAEGPRGQAPDAPRRNRDRSDDDGLAPAAGRPTERRARQASAPQGEPQERARPRRLPARRTSDRRRRLGQAGQVADRALGLAGQLPRPG